MRADEIEDTLSFSGWLDARPNSSVPLEAAVIAHRAAMRVFPYMLGINQSVSTSQPEAVFAFHSIRSSITTRVSCDRHSPSSLSEAASEIYKILGNTKIAAQNYMEGDSRNFGLVHSTRATRLVSALLASYSSDESKNYAVSSVGEAILAVEHQEAANDMWLEIQSDAHALESGVTSLALAESGLWRKEPLWWSDIEQNSNRKLHNAESLDHGLDLWADWYGSVSRGQSIFGIRNVKLRRELERNIALGSTDGTCNSEFWRRFAREINADITRWVQDAQRLDFELQHESRKVDMLPEEATVRQPHPSITQFTQGPDGRIAAVADPLEPAKGRDLQDIEELYDDARSKALALRALGRNMLGGCYGAVEQLLAHTPEHFGSVRVNRIFAKLSTLRDRVDLHDLQMSKQAEDRDIALVLQEEVAVTLKSCVRQFNLLMAFDKRGQELNSLQHGPEARQRADETNKAVQPVVLNIGDIAEGATVTIIQGDNSNILTAPRDIHGDQAAVRSALQNENLMMRIIQVGWSIAKETERQGLSEPTVQLVIAVGGQHGVKILEFIQKYDEIFLWMSQHVEAFYNLGPLVLMLFAYAKVLAKTNN